MKNGRIIFFEKFPLAVKEVIFFIYDRKMHKEEFFNLVRVKLEKNLNTTKKGKKLRFEVSSFVRKKIQKSMLES